MSREASHYVVTAHPPNGVLHTVKCNFLAADSEVSNKRASKHCHHCGSNTPSTRFSRMIFSNFYDIFRTGCGDWQIEIPRSSTASKILEKIRRRRNHCEWKRISLSGRFERPHQRSHHLTLGDPAGFQAHVALVCDHRSTPICGHWI